MPEPMAIFGDDSRSDIRPIYCYIIRQLDTAIASLFLTSYDGEIEIENLPDHYGADSPQIFTPANIGHGPIRREGNFDKSTFQIRARTAELDGVSRYALTGAIPKIQIDVIKVNPGRVDDGIACRWQYDTRTSQTGLINTLGFQGFTIVAECVPEPLFSNQEIPRWRFSRTCNHELYSPACGVDQADFTLTGNISALNLNQKIVTIDDTFPGSDDDFFRQGVMTHVPTGVRLSVFKSWKEGGETYAKLAQWLPDFEVGDAVTISAGCRHKFFVCRDKFSNAHNFGGFSKVPNKNPSQHGVK